MFEAPWKNYLGTLLVGVLGGVLAYLIHWPLPWMIGPLVAVILVRCCTPWQLVNVPGGRKLGQWIIGIGIGLHFSTAVVEQIAEHALVIFIGALITTLGSAMGIWLLRKTGESPATAFFASMPGGSAEMANLGYRHGADLSRVAAAQSLRVVVVVLSVPAIFKFVIGDGQLHSSIATVDWAWLVLIFTCGGLAGWGLQRINQPNPWMFGPLFVTAPLSALFDLHIALPEGASQLGQLLIGSSLGCYFDRSFFQRAPSFLLRSFIATLLMMVFAALAAVGLGLIATLDIRASILGMMPGGIAEMSLTAEVLQLSVPLVTAMQMLRLLLVMFLAEWVFKRWQKWT